MEALIIITNFTPMKVSEEVKKDIEKMMIELINDSKKPGK